MVRLSMKKRCIFLGSGLLLLFVFLLNIKGYNDNISKRNVSIEKPITSYKQIYEISKHMSTKWDKRASCVSLITKFDFSQDIETLNAKFFTECIFSEDKNTGYSVQEGKMNLKFDYNSDVITEINARKGSNFYALHGSGLVLNPEAAEIKEVLNHILDIKDIPEIVTQIFGNDWKNEYSNSFLTIIVFNDYWSFIMRDKATNEESYGYINPYNGEVYCE